jgi:hypothetical protein
MSLGLQMHVENREALTRFRDVLERATAADLAERIFWPWVRWVLKVRIPKMYWNKGRVSGADGQAGWSALSKWTLAGKGVGKFGHGGSALSPLVSPGMGMAQSYAIGQQRTGPQSWRFEMTNTARSSSQWSPGFDYPSALHTGWGPYTVRPRNAKILTWPTRKGTVISAGAGRADGKRRKQTVESDAVFARETHPRGAPSRPHIKFFQIDVAALGKLTLDYVLRGLPPGSSEPTA